MLQGSLKTSHQLVTAKLKEVRNKIPNPEEIDGAFNFEL